MIFFKKQIYLSLLAVTSLTLSACIPKTQDRPEGTGTGGSNFVVSAVSGSIAASKNVGDFPLPGERTYNFKACLIDFSRRTNIPNAKFTVTELDNKQLATDAQGCLNWPETIKFNFLADSVWLKITRTFTAVGLQRGSQEIHFAINPWSHGENLADVLDLAKQSTPYLLENESDVQTRLASTDKTRTIWVENGELNVTNGKDAYSWQDQIFLKPQIQFLKTDATPVLIPIMAGSFKAEVTLISEDMQNQKTVRTTWGKQVVEKASINNGTLMIDVNFALQKGPTTGQTFLGIKLTPVGAPAGLLPFEGVFPLGGPQAFTQSSSLKVSQTVATENAKGQFSIQKFIGKESKDVNQTKSQGSVGIEIGHFNIHDFKVDKEKGQSKSLTYRAQTCLKNIVGKTSLAKLPFKIETLNEKGQVLDSTTTLSSVDSCLYWEGHTESFDRYECNHYVKNSIRITNENLSIDQTESILINPFDLGHEKGVDQREAIDQKQYATSCKDAEGLRKADNIILMKNMTLTRILYRPQVLDRTLQLSQKAVYGIDVSNAGIIDFSNETMGLNGASKYFTAGKYLLRLAFVRAANTRADNGYVGHADIILDGNGTSLVGKFELDIKDLQSTLIRKTVLAQLFPIDNEKYNSKKWANNDADIESLIDKKTKLISPVYASETFSLANPAPIIFTQKADGLSSIAEQIAQGFKVTPTSSTLIHDIVAAGEVAQANMIKKNAFKENDGKAWDKWSKDQNLQLTWLSDGPSIQYLKNEFGLTGDAKTQLQNLVMMNKLDTEWATKFCMVLANGPYKQLATRSDFNRFFIPYCKATVEEKPDTFIKKSVVYRIITMKPALLRPQSLGVSNFTLSSSFGYSTGHTEVEGTQAGLTLSAGLGGNVGIASAGLGASYGVMRSVTDDLNRHSGSDASTSMGVGVTRWQMDIPVTSYQQCTILRVDPTVFFPRKETSFFKPWTWRPAIDALRARIDLSGLFKPNQVPNPLSKGWLICSDVVTKNQIMLPETFHMVSQNNSDETYDTLDDLNHRFLLSIRGESDWARFKTNVLETTNYPASGELTDEVAADLNKQILPLMNKRMDPAPGMIMYDSQFQMEPSTGTQGAWGF